MKKIYFISCILTLMFITGCDTNLDSIYTTEESINVNSEPEIRSVDSGQLDYYWYQGKKIFLKQKATKQYVLFHAEKEPVVAKAVRKTGVNSYASKEFKLTCVKAMSKATKAKNLKWCIVQNGNAYIKDLTKSSDIEYSAPFFENIDDGEEVGISHLFYVKLKTKEDRDLLIDLASKLKVEVLGNNEYMPLWYTLSCDVNSAGNSLQMANAFYESGLFEAAEPDFIFAVELASTSASSFPNDPYFNKQWNLDGTYSINWKQAHSLSTGANVEISIIDDGADYMHPDFNWKLMPAYDLRTNSLYSTGLYGTHGTECAGVICAQVNNNEGIAGVSPNSNVYMYAHPFDKNENVNLYQELATGIAMASESSDVISCSWVCKETSNLITDAIHNALVWGRNKKGVVIVFATGNKYGDIRFPANCDEEILAVGAIGKDGKRADFSNYGAKLDVVAPGEDITTTNVLSSSMPLYVTTEGTSIACPQVAGVAALILSVNPDLTSEGVI
ncbi:MAG: S8 family serine peptidase, partial [Prevotella sp.]|nr:S8 family serine peptidase [Prevotella sp.]